jgi:glycosyltransferase involved in cell wall biosynthesis
MSRSGTASCWSRHAVNDARPTVLVLLGCFNKATEASGPTQSMIGNARALATRFRFRVVGHSAEGDVPMQWTEMSGVERLPLPANPLLPGRLRQIIRETPHDLLVCTSFFDRALTIPALLLRRLGMIPRTPMLLAPRGEFSAGALQLKWGRKAKFIALAERLQLLRDVHIQATDQIEAEAIRKALPSAPSILIGPNVRHAAGLPPHRPRASGRPLRIAFLSRIDVKKNLHVALKLLGNASIDAEFTIIGPVSDHRYWRECQAIAAGIPPNISVKVRGAIPASEVIGELARHDLFLLPTAGENYGHAIVDAFVAGTPVMISDQTPWRGLCEVRAGIDLPLGEPEQWLEWLRRFAAMDAGELAQWRTGAREFGERATGTAEAAAELEACLTMAIHKSLP